MKTVYINEDLTTGNQNGTSWADAYRTWATFLTGEQGTLTDDVTVYIRSTGIVSASRALLAASWTLGSYTLKFIGDSDCRLYYNSTTTRVVRNQLSGVIFENITTIEGGYGFEVTGSNNIFVNCNSVRATLRGWYVSTGTGNICYNCIGVDGEFGFHFGLVSGTLINCYAGGTSTNDYYGTSGSFTKTTCASEDDTGSVGLTGIAYSTATFTNVTSGSEDFMPPVGSGLIGVGTDLHADATYPFDYDYNGDTRQTWSVGSIAAASDLLTPHSVTYDGNGNTGGSVPTDANTYTYGQNVTVLGYGTLVRTDYTQIGWNTAANGSGTHYDIDDTFQMPDADVTLYAEWEVASATNHYVRAGATGTGTGADWTNAYATLPATLVRGEVYYVADGSYAAYTIDDAVSGTDYIDIRKATAADHGTETGWDASYGDGVATFAQIVPATSYIKFDGQVGGGPGSFETGHGFKIYSASANRRIYFSGNGLTNIEFHHVDIEGLGYHADYAGEDGIHAINGVTDAGPANVTIDHCYVHDFTYGGQLIQTIYCDTWLLEYNKFARCSSNPTYHSELWQDFGSNNVIFRFNETEDIEGTAVIALAKSTATGLAYTHTGWEIYRNKFYMNYDCTGRCSGGIFCDARGSGDTGGAVTGTRFYHNTIYGILGLNSGVTLQIGSDNLVYNNIWMECYRDETRAVGNAIFGAAVTTRDYNAFLNSRYTGVGLNANDEELSSDPFVNAAGFDFRLTGHTTTGLWLGSTYATDMAGNTDTESSVDRGSLVYATLGTLTVTFDANGADSGTPPSPAEVTEGDSTALPSNTGNLVKSGFTMAGWRQYAGSGQIYSIGYLYSPVANVTLYAYWQSATSAGGNKNINVSVAMGL